MEFTVTRSAEADEAILIFIDATEDELATGLRILVNDDEVFMTKEYDHESGWGRPAKFKCFTVSLEDIGYKEDGS